MIEKYLDCLEDFDRNINVKGDTAESSERSEESHREGSCHLKGHIWYPKLKVAGNMNI